jgi:hypothetical protein
MGQGSREVKWRRVAGLAILAVLPLLSSGCLVVAAGAAATGAAAAGGYLYLQGKDTREYPADIENTWQATRVALGELGLPIIRAERESNSGSLESRTRDGEVVNISAEAVPGKTPTDPPLTLVSVRVSLLGDHPLSTRVLDQIGYHLVPSGSSPPPPLAGAVPPPGVARPSGTAEPPRWSAPTPLPAPPPPPPETQAPPLLPGPAAGPH